MKFLAGGMAVEPTVTSYFWFQTFAVYWMLYAFFWVIPRRLKFICRRFGTLCLFHLHRQVGACRTLWRTAPQGSPRTPAKCIAVTTPGLIVRILKFWF